MNSRGSDMKDIDKFDPKHFTSDQVLLDNRTGDFYQAKEQKEWQLSGNVGLHWINALGKKTLLVKKAEVS